MHVHIAWRTSEIKWGKMKGSVDWLAQGPKTGMRIQ